MRAIRQIENMLQDAAKKRSWGSITIDLKDGKPLLVKQTIQVKVDEEYPEHGNTVIGAK